VRLEGLDRRLAAKTFGGDPTLLETMTHHDAASNSTTHAPGRSQSLSWNDLQKMKEQPKRPWNFGNRLAQRVFSQSRLSKRDKQDDYSH
jgi:hypothetical protein